MISFEQSALTFHPENGKIIQIILLPSSLCQSYVEIFPHKHIDCGSLIKYKEIFQDRVRVYCALAAQGSVWWPGPHMCLVKFLIYAAIWIVSA